MTHVLVAHELPSLRYALTSLLRQRQFLVTEVSDGVLALTALWLARRPLVAVLDEQLTLLDTQYILDFAAAGDGLLARHRYVVLTTELPGQVRPQLRAVLTALNATLLHVPSDICDLSKAVADAAPYLLRPVVDAAVTSPFLERLEQRLEQRLEWLAGPGSCAIPSTLSTG